MMMSTSTQQTGLQARMRRGMAGFAVALVLAAGLVATPPGHARAAPESFADLAEKLQPAVVNIATTQVTRERSQRGPDMPQFPPGSPFEEFFRDFFDRNQQGQNRTPRRATSLGSGFVIDASGYVVTNNHVIADADEVSVRMHDDTEFKAKIIGRDQKTDLALLKIEPGNYKLKAVPWGDSNKARVGDWVLAIGNPFGLGGSVTAGIVSARSRDISQGPYDDFIQTDASINRGNSGGPMFNMAGEVIGINTAIYSPTGGSVGIGFSIPASLAKPVIEQLREYGRTRRGWLGVRIQMVTDEIAESLGLDKAKGALVASVTDGGPADKAGIKAGDIVLKFDGKDVQDMRRLPRIVAETRIERNVPVEVWRERKLVSLTAKVGELEEAEANNQIATVSPDRGDASQMVAGLGMTLSPITGDLRQRFNLKGEAQGVVVTEVTPDSAASEKGIRPGDVIVEVGQEVVKSPREIADKVKKARDSGRKSVLLLVDRQGEMRFVALRVDQG